MKQDGYLVLAHSQKALASLKKSVETQHLYGVPSELLSAEDCLKMVPALGKERLVGGAFCGLVGLIRIIRVTKHRRKNKEQLAAFYISFSKQRFNT